MSNPDAVVIVTADSVTKLPAETPGAVVVSGSHGGVYAAYRAAAAGARALILNDAGVGLDQAGIGCLHYGQTLGMAVATVASASCRIGDVADMLARGKISHANLLATDCCVTPGMACRDAAKLLKNAPLATGEPAVYAEGRTTVTLENGLAVVLIDSAAMVQPEDAGQVVVTGSHGALIGSDPWAALRVAAALAVFNDAGGGSDDGGYSRLPALASRGIIGMTVAAESARIGEARSTLDDGVISAVNEPGVAVGFRVGEPLREALANKTLGAL